MKQYEKLIVWQESHQLCIDSYKILSKFPTEERFGLCSQIRRSAYGVPMNIVEGNTRRSLKDKLRFMEIAEGSLDELHYQFLLSKDLSYISEKDLSSLKDQIYKVAYLLRKFRVGISKNP